MGWDGQQYEIRACYATEITPVKEDARDSSTESPPVQGASGIVAGVDLGEIHLAVVHDGEQTYILNGRALRAKRQYQNRLKAKLSSRIDKRPKGSKRRKRLIRSKKKQLAKLNHQIKDIQHKQTTKLVSTFKSRNVQTVVIGDIRDIRKSVNYGKKANQKIHQMLHGQTRQMISYKAQKLGMKVELQDERYTSQTCPQCGKRHKPKNRVYKCSCGFQFHRDGVGAINIRKKYLGCMDIPVIGVMAAPIGLRFRPHTKCSTVPVSSSILEATCSERIPLL